jgi:hypothetical protein
MRKLYGSFLVRCWRMETEERFEIQHIQSGDRVVLPSLADIGEWIRSHASDAASAPDGSPRSPPCGDGAARHPSDPGLP